MILSPTILIRWKQLAFSQPPKIGGFERRYRQLKDNYCQKGWINSYTFNDDTEFLQEYMINLCL